MSKEKYNVSLVIKKKIIPSPAMKICSWRLISSAKYQQLSSRESYRIWFNNLINCSFGEGNSNPLQYSCLENPMDRRAWWAAIYGVAQSRAQLKRLSSSKLLINELLYQIILWNVSQAESSVLFQAITRHQKYIIRFRYRYIVFQNIFPVWKVTVFSLRPFLLVHILQFSSVTRSCVTLATPWTVARQASLSITNSWSLLKLMSIELVMSSNYLILCGPLPHIFNAI